MPNYSYKIVDRNLATVSVVVNADDRSYKKSLNHTGEASFSVSVYDNIFNDIPGLLNGLTYYGLIIERDGVKVYGGELTSYSVSVDDSDPRITLNSRSWENMLERRVTPKPIRYGAPAGLASVDAGEIAWDLIDSTQKGWGIDFDGSTQYLSNAAPLNAVPATNKLTIGGWFSFTSPLASGTLPGNGTRTEVLVAKGDGSHVSYRLYRTLTVAASVPSDILTFEVASSNGTTRNTVSLPAHYKSGVGNKYLAGTFFVCGSWDGSTNTMVLSAWDSDGLHINDTTETTGLVTTGPATTYSGAEPLYIGRNSDAANSYFDGIADDVFITNDFHGKSTGTQPMTDIRDGNVSLMDLSTIGWWRMDSGTESYTYDWSANTTPNDLLLNLSPTYVTGLRDVLPEYDYGITQGTIETSQDRDREYETKNIAQAIRDLTEVINGFDYEITPLKEFNVYYPGKGSVKESIVFEYGKNIEAPTVDANNDQISNEVIAIGEGQAADTNSPTLATHYVNKNNLLANLWRQTVTSAKDVSILDTLREKAAEDARVYGATQKKYAFGLMPGLEPQLGEYELGDICRLIIRLGVIDEDTLFRIYVISVEIDENDQEKVSLEVSTLV